MRWVADRDRRLANARQIEHIELARQKSVAVPYFRAGERKAVSGCIGGIVEDLLDDSWMGDHRCVGQRPVRVLTDIHSGHD